MFVKDGYYIPEIASQFFVMGLVAGIIGIIFHLNDMHLNDIPAAFNQGAADLLGAAMCVGMHRVSLLSWVEQMLPQELY